jgi:cytochrome b involved in lipid metabolism
MYIVVYENKVLDIASFRDEHPGGPDVFEGYQGGVITEAFDDAGHTSAAKADMDDYLIGTLSASSGAGAARGAAPSREEEIAKRRPSAFWTTWVPLIGAAVAGVAVFLVISARRQPVTTSRR